MTKEQEAAILAFIVAATSGEALVKTGQSLERLLGKKGALAAAAIVMDWVNRKEPQRRLDS